MIIKKLYLFLWLFVLFSCNTGNRNLPDNENEPSSNPISINNCITSQGSYEGGESVTLSFTLSNNTSTQVKIKNVKATIRNINRSGQLIKEVSLAGNLTIPGNDQYLSDATEIWTIPQNEEKDPFGIYVEYELDNGKKISAYQTFFHVVDKSMITTFQLARDSYKGLNVFSLNGGMSAEYAIEKSGANLASGISDSWKVNAHASGPNHVYATPQFLENSVKQTVQFYDQILGANTSCKTVIISTGIPSVPYLSSAMKAPVLPLHFLVSVNTVKEIQTILDYSIRKGFQTYATLGHDPSVPYAVAWVKLLDIPSEYVDFLTRHQVENIILLGATAPTGGETIAKRVISNEPSSPNNYADGSLFILYPQGGVAADETALKDKIKDINEIKLQPQFTRIADWESGIIPEQVINFSNSIKNKTSIRDIRFITAAEDDGELYNLATYTSLAFIYKNQKEFTKGGSSPINGIALDPYLLSDPLYENRFKYIPLVYWQGNPLSATIDKIDHVVKAGIASYFPNIKLEELTFWINSSINFGGPEKAIAMKKALQSKGLSKIKENDYSMDEVWDPKDGMKAPCEVRAIDLINFSTSQDLKNWNDHLVPLTPMDLMDLSARFPAIIIKKM